MQKKVKGDENDKNCPHIFVKTSLATDELGAPYTDDIASEFDRHTNKDTAHSIISTPFFLDPTIIFFYYCPKERFIVGSRDLLIDMTVSSILGLICPHGIFILCFDLFSYLCISYIYVKQNKKQMKISKNQLD